MLKKVNELTRAKQQYIFRLQYQGKLKRYIVDGRVAFDTEEEEEHRTTAKKGRPISTKVKIERSDDNV